MLIFKMSTVNLLCLILVQPFRTKLLTPSSVGTIFIFKHNLKNFFLKEVLKTLFKSILNF